MFIICSSGELFHVGSAEGFTYDEAATSCQEQNAILASTGELYAAWKMGFDKCRAGWLVDRSVRYPINNPRAQCGAGIAGVHTVYADPERTRYPEPNARFDAYCVRGTHLIVDTGHILHFYFHHFNWCNSFAVFPVKSLQRTFSLLQMKLDSTSQISKRSSWTWHQFLICWGLVSLN